jgi:hypothetical protein
METGELRQLDLSAAGIDRRDPDVRTRAIERLK